MLTLDLSKTIARRDNLSEAEVVELIDEARERVAAGHDPEDVLSEEFGLEPDYIFDLLSDAY